MELSVCPPSTAGASFNNVKSSDDYRLSYEMYTYSIAYISEAKISGRPAPRILKLAFQRHENTPSKWYAFIPFRWGC